MHRSRTSVSSRSRARVLELLKLLCCAWLVEYWICRRLIQFCTYGEGRAVYNVGFNGEVVTSYVGVDVRIHAFSISALDGGQWQFSNPRRFITGKSPRHSLNGAQIKYYSRFLCLFIHCCPYLHVPCFAGSKEYGICAWSHGNDLCCSVKLHPVP